MPKLTHLDCKGSARIVNVGAKKATKRRAIVSALVLMKPATLQAITANKIKKGNVLDTARIASIMAAKDTCKLIPLCHPINITNIQIDFRIITKPAGIEIKTLVEGYDRTGVEMEALVAASLAALTIYDMCKAIDRGMRITDIKLLEKSGGKSDYHAK